MIEDSGSSRLKTPKDRFHSAVVLASNNHVQKSVSGYLLQLDCQTASSDSVGGVLRLVALHVPRLVFLECRQYPLQLREITGLVRDAAGPGRRRPWLIGLSSAEFPIDDHESLGLNEAMPPAPGLSDFDALLQRRASSRAASTGGDGSGDGADPVVGLPPTMQATLMKVFVEDTAGRLERVRQGVIKYDMVQIGREAHAIKSGCLQVGEVSLAECSERLRMAAVSNDSCGVQRHFADLLVAFQGVAGHLRS